MQAPSSDVIIAKMQRWRSSFGFRGKFDISPFSSFCPPSFSIIPTLTADAFPVKDIRLLPSYARSLSVWYRGEPNRNPGCVWYSCVSLDTAEGLTCQRNVIVNGSSSHFLGKWKPTRHGRRDVISLLILLLARGEGEKSRHTTMYFEASSGSLNRALIFSWFLLTSHSDYN